MNRKSQWKHWLLSGVAAGAITLTVLGAAPQLAFAQSTPAAPAQGSDATTPAQPASPLRGRGAADTDRSQTLADALGITVDELNAARDAARDAALDQAVAEGLLTQEQADAIRNGEGRGLGIRMPRGQENAPGTRPSRSSSRGSRMSTSKTSSRPTSATAADAGISSISALALAIMSWTPFLISCGMVFS